MRKCVKEDCDYFKTYGECSFVCEHNGFKKVVTNYDRILTMSVEEMARFFATGKSPDFPNSPCYVCEYDKGLFCDNDDGCTEEHRTNVYKKWLESEVDK